MKLEICVALPVIANSKLPILSPCHVPRFLFPDCSVCSKNYVPGLSFICRKCSDSAMSYTIAAVVTVMIVAVGLTIVFYLLSTERSVVGQGIVASITQRLPTQSVKIIIVVWQILTQVRAVNRREACSSKL